MPCDKTFFEITLSKTNKVPVAPNKRINPSHFVLNSAKFLSTSVVLNIG